MGKLTSCLFLILAIGCHGAGLTEECVSYAKKWAGHHKIANPTITCRHRHADTAWCDVVSEGGQRYRLKCASQNAAEPVGCSLVEE